MRLLDTNVVVYARSESSPFKKWAEEQIAEAVSTEGAALNAVSLAELCAEPGIDPSVVARAVTDSVCRLWMFHRPRQHGAERLTGSIAKHEAKLPARVLPLCHYRTSLLARMRSCWALNL